MKLTQTKQNSANSKDENDNPSIGLVLCADKNDAMVEYLLSKNNEQIFASRYKLFLPDTERLRFEMIREVRLLGGGGL